MGIAIGVGVGVVFGAAALSYVGAAAGAGAAVGVGASTAVAAGASAGAGRAYATYAADGASAGTSTVSARAMARGASAGVGSAAGVAASSWTPADLGAKLIDYWQSHVGITLNGSDVSNWEGQANSVDLSQATAAKQPAYDTVNTINGRSVVAPAGAEALVLAAGHGLSGATKACLLMVIRNASTTASHLFEANPNITVDGLLFGIGTSSANADHTGCNGDGAAYQMNVYGVATTDTWLIAVCQYDTTQVDETDQSTYRKNGVAQSEASSPGSATSGSLGNNAHTFFSRNNAASLMWTGRCAAIALMKDLPTSGELALLESWAATEYGL